MFDRAAFDKEMHKALEIAEAQPAPTVVEAKVVKQGGQDILLGRCPGCTTVAALSGEGRHLCRTCFTWLEYRRKE